ncbi:putative mfs protein [Phaeoacremonium minimum UCRPA7]|uniref:Putative mfs protein n=1 Tax=Phaeoacremonium minimum (strain UCR-PA7) TaxID=1286976 RepID=R8BA94_PHAM7|nr:putative mfs protein [Phaeoacremonium minimum UCRPA7]EON96208.1 putative mfs protein [Phaeoacremonium minimum UCRPA7]
MYPRELTKRVLRKVDWILIPLVAGTYMLHFVDKMALSYAAVFDLFPSTGITQVQYAWFGSIFYFAYMAAEYPLVWLAQKTRMAKVIAGCVLGWGAVMMLTVACDSFVGMAACRFFLGVFEAPTTTCFMMMVAMCVGMMLAGVLNLAIGRITIIPVWKAVFLVNGGMTIVWGLLLLIFLPDDVISAKRFTLEEKALLIARGRLARTGILNKTVRLYQVKEAFKDPQVWLLAVLMFLNEVVNGGLSNFGKLILKDVTKDPFRTVALGIPAGVFGISWILSGTWLASKLPNFRTHVMALYNIPTIIGISLLWKLDRTKHEIGLLFAYYIVTGYIVTLFLGMQMPATNLGGYTKRTTGSVIVFMSYCIGNILGPHAFRGEEAPLYPTGCKVIIACCIGQIILAYALRLLLTRRNKERDRQATEIGLSEEIVDTLKDRTDFENPHFRYVL